MTECKITYEDGAVVTGACDLSLYDTPYEGTGYDPNWVSCFFIHQNGDYTGNEIYCFHPNQGHGNTVPTGCEKTGCETIEQVKAQGITELPKTGAGTTFISIVIALIIIGGLWKLFKFLAN